MNSSNGSHETFSFMVERCIWLHIMFEDVLYKIKTEIKIRVAGGGVSRNKMNRYIRATQVRTILKSISGVAFPGEILAMLGPSGSGKTTLLTALAGRLGGDLTGTIMYNDKPFSSAMRRNMGFVTQDDVLSPNLTVNETLYYTALLRLPGSLTRREKAEQVDQVMVQLGLNSCRDRIIGGPLLRGVSGGERKRVSIGQEMLVNPSLILLDEPTSGLDSTTAQKIVSTLWGIATSSGQTVVMTIHQPSSPLFYMFHKILLLSDVGHPVFYGKGVDAIDYFTRIGFAPSVAMNPSDFLLDLANAVRGTLLKAYSVKIKPLVKEELRVARKKFADAAAEKEKDREENREEKEKEKKVDEIVGELWYTSWWEQFQVLLERGLKERRHSSFAPLKITQITFISLLSGCLWWQSQSRVQDQVGLVFFITSFWIFFSLLQSLFTFPQERIMLTKERSSGTYRLSSYFMSRIVGDLHMDLALPLFSVTVLYWMAGLKPSAAHFLEMLLAMVLGVLASSGLGLALGALVTDLKTATTLGSTIGLTFILVGGFYVQKVPVFVAWIKYLSIPFHTFKLTLSTQFYRNETYDCGVVPGGGGGCLIKDLRQVAAVGLDGKLWPLVVLFGMCVFYRLVAYVALMNVGKVTR